MAGGVQSCNELGRIQGCVCKCGCCLLPALTLALPPSRSLASLAIYADTPGVHLSHRIPHMLSPDELKLLHPRKRLRAYLPPTPLTLTLSSDGDEFEFDAAAATAAASGGSSSGKKLPKAVSATYLWSGLVRVDVADAPPNTALAFYGPASMRVWALPALAEGDSLELGGAEEEGEEEGGRGDKVLLPTASVEARGGLVPTVLVVQPAGMGADSRAALADIAVSGLPGWVSVHVPRAQKALRLRVWAPRGVEVFLRPPLPCPSPMQEQVRCRSEMTAGREGGGRACIGCTRCTCLCCCMVRHSKRCTLLLTGTACTSGLLSPCAFHTLH